jgi:hypothetical protein
MPPVPGAAFAVGNGDDEDVVNFDGVEHGVWKDSRSTDMHILLKNAPTLGRGDNLGDGGSDFFSEALAQGATALIVKLDGLREFQGCIGMELVPHFVSRRSMRR